MSKCKTPGATYSIAVHNGGYAVSVVVSAPFRISLNQKQVRAFKRRLHDGVEDAFAATFRAGWFRRAGGPIRGERRMVPLDNDE